ncbi:MAG: hypothetical protein IJD95_03075 [Clostridia bacterium]|nr:hypothetical protein [Clostridia bacterium]
MFLMWLQIEGLCIVLFALFKVVSFLFNWYIQILIKKRKKYDKKHSVDSVSIIDKDSIYYQLSILNGNFLYILLVMIFGGILLLMPSDNSTIDIILLAVLIALCLIKLSKTSKKYRTAFFSLIFITVSLITLWIVIRNIDVTADLKNLNFLRTAMFFWLLLAHFRVAVFLKNIIKNKWQVKPD